MTDSTKQAMQWERLICNKRLGMERYRTSRHKRAAISSATLTDLSFHPLSADCRTRRKCFRYLAASLSTTA